MAEHYPLRVKSQEHAHSKEATCLAFSDCGAFLATGGGDSLIKIWDTYTDTTELLTTTEFNRAISTLSFLNDNNNMAVCTLDRVINLCDVSHDGLHI